MDVFAWPSTVGLIAILIIILGVIAIKKFKDNPIPLDYRALYNIGIIFFIVGIPLKNYDLSALGLIFFLTGIANKKSWKIQPETIKIQKKFMTIALVIGALALIAGIIMYYLKIN